MTDLYVQVETGFPESKLVDKAREMLGVSTDVAIAKLVRLWLRTMAVGCHGQIGERSDGWIEEAVAWTGEPGKFAAFVRLHHLDDSGVIRDWLDKYGAVEEGRRKARVKKQSQRARARGDVPGTEAGTDEGQSGGPKRDVPVTLLQSPISTLETPSTGSIKSEREREPDDLATRRADAMQSLTLFLSRHDFGRWHDAVEGFIRSSEKPVNVIAHLDLWLTGEMGYKKREPSVVGFAINQYAAAHPRDGFKPALFDGFVRRVKGQMDRNVSAEARAMEDSRLVQERREREEREKDEREQQMLNDFERTNEERFMELKAKAEASVEKRYKGEIRAHMVRAVLIDLVRKEAR